MKLGSKGRDVESFVDQLKNEGEIVQAATIKSAVISSKLPPPSMANVDEYVTSVLSYNYSIL